MILSYINYKKQPEYFFGIGNDVSVDNLEEIEFDRWKFVTAAMRRVGEGYSYVGFALDIADYYNVQLDSNSIILEDNLLGQTGGTCFGLGLSYAWDSRDNRYNPYGGSFILTSLMNFPQWLGSRYTFTKFEFDVRKYFNPWLKHVIALQTTTSIRSGDVPFYEMSMLGGEDKMRGYYKGALRDNVLVDAQVEYRLPIWNIFGMTTWVGTGRVAHSVDDLSFKDFWISYGAGVRVRVDTKNNTNLRFDFGFGRGNINGFYINFAEAF
jgi:outer membrane protein assembly factor BamA